MAGKKLQVKVPMSEMLNVSVEWVSLVDRPANRIPFRVVKRDSEGNELYRPDHVELSEEARNAGRVTNHQAVGILGAAVLSGRINTTAPWNFSEYEGSPEAFSAMHLCVNKGADPNTKARWSFPVAKSVAGRIVVFRSAVEHARDLAQEMGEAPIASAASSLLNLIDNKRQ